MRDLQCISAENSGCKLLHVHVDILGGGVLVVDAIELEGPGLPRWQRGRAASLLPQGCLPQPQTKGCEALGGYEASFLHCRIWPRS